MDTYYEPQIVFEQIVQDEVIEPEADSWEVECDEYCKVEEQVINDQIDLGVWEEDHDQEWWDTLWEIIDAMVQWNMISGKADLDG